MIEDCALVERWRGGDASAGKALFQRYFDELYAFFRGKVLADVDDLVQRTFLACLEHKDGFRGDSTFRTWMYAIARNELYAAWRRTRQAHDRIDPDALDSSARTLADLGVPAPEALARRQEQRLLLAALRHVSLDDRVLLELYYWRGLSGPELGQIFDLPEGTVRTRLRRAKAKLEEEIARQAERQDLARSTLEGLDDWLRSLRVALAL